MAWEARGGSRYYYTGKRVNGQVKKTYVGDGPGVEAIAWLDRRDWENRKVEQDFTRLDIADMECDRRDLQAECRQVEVVAALHLTAAGYHRHKRGPWRRRRQRIDQGADMKQIEGRASIPATDRERRALVQKAIDNPGDKEAFTASVAVIEAYPECAPMMMSSSLYSVMKKRIGDDPTEARERVLKANVEGMRAALSGANPTPLEVMLIDRVLACWVYLAHCQSAATIKTAPNQAMLTYRYKRVEAANRMYLAAVKTLAEVRRLALPAVNVALPGAVQINQGEKQINVSAGE